MDLVIKINSEVAGKDKVARLLQYSSKAVYNSLNAKEDAQLVLIHKLKSLEYLLSSFRKRKYFKSYAIFLSDVDGLWYCLWF